jgi:AraC family transcriptional regulator, transcriptional activator of pobA
MSAIEQIDFDRAKYGRALLADACRIREIPGFITEPRSHRLAFYEIALISEGHGHLELDDTALAIEPHRIAVTAPGELRRWRLDRSGLDGFVVFFEADFVGELLGGRLLRELPLLSSRPASRGFAVEPERFRELAAIATQMCDELRTPREDTGHALRAETYRLLVALQREGATVRRDAAAFATTAGTRSRQIYRRFNALVDRHFAEEHEVRAYARMLAIDPQHLGRCVREAAGLTASEVIHRRQFLEARRLLVHTTLGVSSISEELGFSECSYFIRFFKRYAATTPLAFRTRHESDISAPLRDLSPDEEAVTMAG